MAHIVPQKAHDFKMERNRKPADITEEIENPKEAHIGPKALQKK